ncbi:MAG: class I SAM-dependent methyltransferase, partial [Myxococcales bacterium]|nr:class I SAM-dependent methyltransferase [Myxococcales bacterium]
HYDLGNDFYRLWLDPGMTYSCALFARPDTTLEAAQDAKYARLLDLVAPRLGYGVCSIYLAEPDGTLVLRATHGLQPESVGKVRMAPSDGLTGLVAEGERGLFLSRADRHPRYRYFPETGEERFRSFAGVPLLGNGRCLGVLTVQSAQEATFHSNEVMLLETLAEHVVGLIGVSRSLPEAGTSSEELPADAALAARPTKRARRLLGGLGT